MRGSSAYVQDNIVEVVLVSGSRDTFSSVGAEVPTVNHDEPGVGKFLVSASLRIIRRNICFRLLQRGVRNCNAYCLNLNPWSLAQMLSFALISKGADIPV
jgi:hypothetical protein